MALGVITGSGTHSLPGFDGGRPEEVRTEWGEALVSRGRFAGVDVLHVSRHGEGHVRLSNHVTHRANIAALHRLGAAGVVAVTVCGAVDPDVELGSLICFDDLHFLANRLADGSLCTFSRGRRPAARPLDLRGPVLARAARALLGGAREAGVPMRDGGCYGHVDGPRFNTKAEIRGLAAAGVTAVSQTAGRRPCWPARPSSRSR
jgi:purine nucleoside phosphorylase